MGGQGVDPTVLRQGGPLVSRAMTQTLPVMPSALIVGAGFAGLAAARQLTDAGWEAQVIDEGEVPGGRLATLRLDGGRQVDSGGQFVTARDPAFAAALAAWEARGWVRRWCDGIPLLSAAGLAHGHDGFPRWIGVGGMAAFCARLAEGLTLACGTGLAGLAAVDGGWLTTASDGAKQQVDAVVLTMPPPRAAAFLRATRMPAPDGLAEIRYEPCLALAVDLPDAPGALLPPPGAVRVDDPASPLTWIASARGRGQVTSGDLLMLHLRADGEEMPARARIAAALPTLTRLGITMDPAAARCEARLWRNSRCAVPCAEPFLRVAAAAPLLLAGDGFGNCPRVEGAWLSGRAAALALIG